MPTTEFSKEKFAEGVGILNLLTELELTKSNGEGRRLVQQNGISINGAVVDDFKKNITLDDFENNELVIKKVRKSTIELQLNKLYLGKKLKLLS